MCGKLSNGPGICHILILRVQQTNGIDAHFQNHSAVLREKTKENDAKQQNIKQSVSRFRAKVYPNRIGSCNSKKATAPLADLNERWHLRFYDN